MTTLWVGLLGTAFLATTYIYFGYGAVIFVLSRLRVRPVRKADILPSVTLIIAAYNEAETIGAKLENSLGLDYPAEQLEILLVLDGCSDGTEAAAAEFDDPRLRVVSLPRQGKAYALNEAARLASGEILVFTDANTTFESSALRVLVRSFADDQVGGVCGNQRFQQVEGDSTGSGEGAYWRFDKWLKRLESRTGSIFAADGAIYGLRKELYVPIENPAQADDIAISTRVVLQGYRLVFEEEALAYEPPPGDARREFQRKVRVTNHSVNALLNLGPALWLSGFYSFKLLSHKFFRHLTWVFLVLMLLSHLALLGRYEILDWMLVPHLLFYVLGFVGFLLRSSPLGRSRLLTIPFYFGFVNLAALVGTWSLVRGDRLSRWEPRGGGSVG